MGEEDSYTIKLVEEDGSTHTVDAVATASILESTDRRGIELRHGCREGRCVSCTGLLLEGDVSYEVEPAALNERQRSEGFVLLCIAKPTADCVIEVGRTVLAQAFPRLWQTESHPDIEPLRKARRQLRTVTRTTSARPDHLGGALEPFENLHEIYEAYRHAMGSTEGHAHHRK